MNLKFNYSDDYDLYRYKMFEKAFRLAIDLNDHDLFMDIHFYAVVLNDMELATAAKEKAESILSRSNSCSGSRKKSCQIFKKAYKHTLYLDIFIDSTCSRTSCSICSDSSNEKREEEVEEENEEVEEEEDEEQEEEEEEEEEIEATYSEGSEDSQKEKPNLKQSRKHHRKHYRKTNSNQIPPLPIVHPHRTAKNTLCASYNNIPSTTKTDYILVPSSFDTSDNILTTSFNHSSYISTPFLASTSFNKSIYSTHSNFTSTSSANIINSSQVFNNTSDDLMTTSFGSTSLTESEVIVNDHSGNNFDERSYDESLLNKIPYSFSSSAINVTTCAQDDSFISTPFNKSMYESENVHSNYLTNCLNVVDNNVMSTSFSTRITENPISYNNSVNALTANDNSEMISMLQSVKSSKISDKSLTLIDTNTTDQLSLPDGICKNLMSTSFNYPEGYTTPESSDITFPNTFNNDQAVKLQHPVTEEKETDVAVPSSSLISSFTNYLHGLPRKNCALSRNTQGLSNIKESEKFESNKTYVPLRILQKQNSTSNILENQKTSLSFKTYRYNYDLDYVSFHGTHDDTDLQLSQTVSRFPSRNFHPSYSVQHGLFEDRYSSRSPQNNTNVNANRETKFSNIPPLPVINTSITNSKICTTCPSFADTPSSLSNEKPKVKFSDTVTHILVPSTVSSFINNIYIYIYTHIHTHIHILFTDSSIQTETIYCTNTYNGS